MHILVMLLGYLPFQRVHSSEDEVDGSEHEDEEDWGSRAPGIETSSTLRTPLKELTGHSNVVIAADWLPNGEHVITASWDRTANLYDVHTGETISQLVGKLWKPMRF